MPYRCQIDAPHFTSILIWRVEKAVAERKEERRQIERAGEKDREIKIKLSTEKCENEEVNERICNQ